MSIIIKGKGEEERRERERKKYKFSIRAYLIVFRSCRIPLCIRCSGSENCFHFIYLFIQKCIASCAFVPLGIFIETFFSLYFFFFFLIISFLSNCESCVRHSNNCFFENDLSWKHEFFFFFFYVEYLYRCLDIAEMGEKKNHITIHVKKKKCHAHLIWLKKKKEKNDQEIEFSWNCQE